MTDVPPVASKHEEFPECPSHLLPNGVSSSAFDPVTLRAAAEAHNRHPFDHEMRVKAWTVLYLLERAGFDA